LAEIMVLRRRPGGEVHIKYTPGLAGTETASSVLN